QRVDRNKVEAKMENGVLTVKLNLKDEVKPRKIEVKTG
ncbi:MAG: Hsp20 family protein, partial [Spirochaetota bacterium]